MAEVDAEDSLVRIHQRQRIELKPRRARQHTQHSKYAALLASDRRGNAEHAEPSRRREHAVSLLPRLAADRVENEFDAAAIGDRAGARFKILGSVIDEMIYAKRA